MAFAVFVLFHLKQKMSSKTRRKKEACECVLFERNERK